MHDREETRAKKLQHTFAWAFSSRSTSLASFANRFCKDTGYCSLHCQMEQGPKSQSLLYSALHSFVIARKFASSSCESLWTVVEPLDAICSLAVSNAAIAMIESDRTQLNYCPNFSAPPYNLSSEMWQMLWIVPSLHHHPRNPGTAPRLLAHDFLCPGSCSKMTDWLPRCTRIVSETFEFTLWP